MRVRLTFLVLALVLFSVPVFSQVPRILNYQGALTDAAGQPAAGEFQITFRLYGELDGGAALWEETQTVSVSDGSLNAVLGKIDPIEIEYDGPLFLGVSIDGTDELLPRTQLTAAPYSLHALSVAAGSVSGTAIADSAVVRSINDLTDAVTLEAGENVSITQNEGTVTISAAASASGGQMEGIRVISRPFGTVSIIGGSEANEFDGTALESGATIGGGGSDNSPNRVEGSFGTVGGGRGNTSGGAATVGGGIDNLATGDNATVGGGSGNSATGGNSTVGGGAANTASGGVALAGNGGATVSGGRQNSATAPNSTVGGGAGNSATEDNATVGGGEANKASATGATVPGGEQNEARGPGSFAAGSGARAIHRGSFVWADRREDTVFSQLVEPDSVLSTQPNQFLVRARGGAVFSTGEDKFQVHAQGGSVFTGDTESMNLTIEADTDNSGEDDQPSLSLSQDGGQVVGRLGFFDGENDLTLKNDFNEGRLHLGTNGEQRLTIGNNGNVGIGLSEPDARLHVSDFVGTAGSSSDHVAMFQNASTRLDASILALKFPFALHNELQLINADLNYLTFIHGSEVVGRISRGNALSTGVVYETSGGDFAEYLPKMDVADTLLAGDIVGVYAGFVSSRTTGADHVMVVTDRPAFLGNAPSKDQKKAYVPVAFMGQVSVKVRGEVAAGDFVLASGSDSGWGVARSPREMDEFDWERVVGRAWESSQDAGVKRVNTVVGLPLGLKHQQRKMAEQGQRIEELERQILEMRTQQTALLEAIESLVVEKHGRRRLTGGQPEGEGAVSPANHSLRLE